MKYSPPEIGQFADINALSEYLMGQLRQIAQVVNSALPAQLDELHVEPVKLRDYMVVAADGSDWNPGAGQGVYAYYAGAWHKLG